MSSAANRIYTRHTFGRRVLAAFAAVSILALNGCSEPTSTEEEILATIAKAEAAAESRDLGDVRKLISDAYSDKRGYDKKEISNLLRLLFVAHQSVHLAVYVENIDIKSPEVAEVVALVGMADTASRLPDVDLYQFDVQLVKRGNKQWQLVEADWRRGFGNAPAR